MLEIKNKPEQTAEISDIHRTEIKEYLDMLDITVDIDTVYLSNLNKKEKRTVITQPGMRYAQAEALVKTLMQDDVFRTFSLVERKNSDSQNPQRYSGAYDGRHCFVGNQDGIP